MIECIMHASNNKFTTIVFSVLSLAIMRGDWYQSGLKPLARVEGMREQAQADISSSDADVQLKVQIKEQRYCRATTANNNMLQMVLSVTFINSGKDRLILFKSGHRIVEYAISKTWDDALANRFESKASLFGSTQLFRLGSNNSLQDITVLIDTPTPSDSFFTIVSPGESYMSEEHLTIPVYVNEDKQQPNDLIEGEHFLQVTLTTWPDVDVASAKLRERWKEHGYLYSKGITSTPISFKFFFDTKIKKCPGS